MPKGKSSSQPTEAKALKSKSKKEKVVEVEEPEEDEISEVPVKSSKQEAIPQWGQDDDEDMNGEQNDFADSDDEDAPAEVAFSSTKSALEKKLKEERKQQQASKLAVKEASKKAKKEKQVEVYRDGEKVDEEEEKKKQKAEKKRRREEAAALAAAAAAEEEAAEEEEADEEEEDQGLHLRLDDESDKLVLSEDIIRQFKELEQQVEREEQGSAAREKLQRKLDKLRSRMRSLEKGMEIEDFHVTVKPLSSVSKLARGLDPIMTSFLANHFYGTRVKRVPAETIYAFRFPRPAPAPGFGFSVVDDLPKPAPKPERKRWRGNSGLLDKTNDLDMNLDFQDDYDEALQ